MDKERIWTLIKKGIEERLGTSVFGLWFSGIELLTLGDNSLELGVDTLFKRDWIDNNYRDAILGSAKDCLGKDISVAFKITKTGAAQKGGYDLASYIKTIKERPGDFYFNPEYNFEKLAVGSFNEIAVSYARHLADNFTDSAINPLFIYGGVGLGKTHIIQAIGNHVRGKYPDLKVGYTTMEGFTNDWIRAINSKEMHVFKEKYECLDMFFVDDIHFITGKFGMQEQFFHLFNNLYNRSKAIVFTADRPISELRDIEERLLSRFGSGQSVEITSPTEVDKISILTKRMSEYAVSLESDCAYFLSQNIKSNVRDLITSIKRISVREKLLGKKMTLDEIRELLRDMFPTNTLNIDVILKETAAFFDVRLSEITSTKRTRNILIPRQVAMYFMKKLLNLSYPAIASEFGGKDHTTVINAVRKIEKLQLTDNDFSVKMNRLKGSLCNSGPKL